MPPRVNIDGVSQVGVELELSLESPNCLITFVVIFLLQDNILDLLALYVERNIF